MKVRMGDKNRYCIRSELITFVQKTYWGVGAILSESLNTNITQNLPDYNYIPLKALFLILIHCRFKGTVDILSIFTHHYVNSNLTFLSSVKEYFKNF